MNRIDQKQWLKYLICFLLAVITIAAYASVAGSTFIAP